MTFGSPLADVSGGGFQFAQRRTNEDTHEVGVGCFGYGSDGGGGGDDLAKGGPVRLVLVMLFYMEPIP